MPYTDGQILIDSSMLLTIRIHLADARVARAPYRRLQHSKFCPIKDGKLVPPPGAYLEGSTGASTFLFILLLPSAIRILPYAAFPLQAFQPNSVQRLLQTSGAV